MPRRAAYHRVAESLVRECVERVIWGNVDAAAEAEDRAGGDCACAE